MANNFKFGNHNIANALFGNRAVKAIYYGSQLIWQKIAKRLLLDDSRKSVFIEYTPSETVTLSSVSFFQQDSFTNGCTYVIHESGYCIAIVSHQNGESETTIYDLTANLKTVSSLGSPTLYAGQKYYFLLAQHQYPSSDQYRDINAYFQNEQGNYKIFTDYGNYAVELTYVDYETYPYKGWIGSSDMTEEEKKNAILNGNLTKNSLFTWNGGYIGPGTLNVLYTHKMNTNLNNVITITNDEISQYSTDAAKYAYVLYRAGTNVGRCIRYLGNSTLSYEGTSMFQRDCFYELEWPMASNKITSMTPVTQQPSNPQTYDMYYKGDTTGSGDWSGITEEAVVIYVNGSWQKAKNWTAEFDEFTWGTITSTNQQYYHKNFLAATKYSDKKYYLRVNGNEV